MTIPQTVIDRFQKEAEAEYPFGSSGQYAGPVSYEKHIDLVNGKRAAYVPARIKGWEESVQFGEWILKESILPRDTVWFDAGKHYTTVELLELFNQQTGAGGLG